MTMPDGPQSSDGLQAQILLELGKLTTSLAVASTKLDTLLLNTADHEQRIRSLEQQAVTISAGRDIWARVVAGLAVAGAIASAVGVYLHR